MLEQLLHLGHFLGGLGCHVFLLADIFAKLVELDFGPVIRGKLALGFPLLVSAGMITIGRIDQDSVTITYTSE